MRQNTLGRTGLSVSIVGLGAAFIGIPHPNQAAQEYAEGRPLGTPSSMDEELGVATVHAALEAGCTLVDTAALYGGTRSERIIGRALKARPDLAAGCTVTTKAGRLREGHDYSADGVRAHVKASLERLGLQRLELVYIHDPMGCPVDQVLGKGGALEGLRRLQEEGVLGHVGVAADDPETNAFYIETGEFEAVVVPEAWSLLNQLAADRILPAAEKYDVGLVVATPVERGLLATGPVKGVDYLSRDFSPECLEHVGKIHSLCKQFEIPLGAAALQWCVRHPRVTATVPGARTPDEAVQNARAGSFRISDEFWSELEPLVRHWEKGVHR